MHVTIKKACSMHSGVLADTDTPVLHRLLDACKAKLCIYTYLCQRVLCFLGSMSYDG